MEKAIDNKLLEKIKKLLSLATSDNENEAKLAAEKANELLLRHNLSRQHIDQISTESYEKGVLDEKRRQSVEEKFIRMILCKFFFVQIITTRKFSVERDARISVVEILGETTNVQIATYTYSFLLRKFRELWESFKTSTGAETATKQSYYWGLYLGLSAQLESQKQKIVHENIDSNSNALVVVNAALDNFVNAQYAKLRRTSVSVGGRHDGNAISAGKTDGGKIRINRGISSTNSGDAKYLK